MYPIPLHNLNEVPKINTIIQVVSSGSIQQSARKKLEHKQGMTLEPEKAERSSIIFVAFFHFWFSSQQWLFAVCISWTESLSKEPAFFTGRFSIDKVNQVKDTYISFSGWGKGIAFVNEFNIGRYWPVKLFLVPSSLVCFLQLHLYLWSISSLNLYLASFAVFWTTMQSLCPCSHPSWWGKCCGTKCLNILLLYILIILNSIFIIFSPIYLCWHIN